MTFWKTKEFMGIQQEWYRALEKHGFIDAEKKIGGEMELKQSASAPYRHIKRLLDIQTKEDYYTRIAQNVHEAKFRNKVDQHIMVLHSLGYRIKDICAELVLIGEKRCRDTIRYVIRRYEMAWGMRIYTRRQLNRK